jgi:hypothetical protein
MPNIRLAPPPVAPRNDPRPQLATANDGAPRASPQIYRFENSASGAGGYLSVGQRAKGSTVCKIYCADSGEAMKPRLGDSGPDLGGCVAGDKVGATLGVQLMREVYLQCKEKPLRQIRDSFISIKGMPALITRQCPICNTSVQIRSNLHKFGPDHFPAYLGVYRVLGGRGVASTR